jgi:polyribonucleotide nucleotidyltransferase
LREPREDISPNAPEDFDYQNQARPDRWGHWFSGGKTIKDIKERIWRRYKLSKTTELCTSLVKTALQEKAKEIVEGMTHEFKVGEMTERGGGEARGLRTGFVRLNDLDTTAWYTCF